MAVPYTFGSATAAIPLSQLDSNFATTITLGNTAIQLGNTVTTLNNMTLANVTVSSGSVIITDVTASGSVTLSGGTANGVAYLNGSKVLTTGSALVFDGSNLGLGVTPSAWQSIAKAFQVGPTGSLFCYTTGAGFGLNIYSTSGANRYIASGLIASSYEQDQAGHKWYTAPSGTAGNVISFTQAMTLDASGNLGISTSSPVQRLHVQDSTANNGTMQLGGTTYYGTIKHNATGSGSNEYNVASASGGGHIFQRGGTTQFMTDSTGNLLVGATTAGAGAGSGRLTVESNSATTSVPVAFSDLRADNSSSNMVYIVRKGAVVGSISTTNVLTAYNTASDYRLKNNQFPLTGSGEFIDALQPKTWEWAQDGSKGVGFIAHEFAEIFPSSVTGEKDAVDAEGKPLYQSMQASSPEVIANLVAEIQSLRKRLAAAGI